jgi:2-polyprenyl-6-methoxyphenol hydroxylase-like FAD-dependent oxidoreductase
MVLEKHGDFLRDFRGDTVHPSTLDLFDELGLLDRLLQRPHEKVAELSAVVRGNSFKVANFGHLPGRGRFIAMMPQWEFLDFLSGEARKLSAFSLDMEAEATALIEEGDRVAGVTTKDGRSIRAGLVIAADGRGSVLRKAAGLPLHDLGAPIDVLWFRVPKRRETKNESAGFIGAGRMIVLIDRGDYWQCARVIGKGEFAAVKALGLDRFRVDMRETAAPVGDAIGELRDWDEVKLLTVSAGAVASPGAAGDRRCGACHVAGGRRRHQPRHSGCRGGGEHPRRAAGEGGGCRTAAGEGAGAAGISGEGDPSPPAGHSPQCHRRGAG